MTLGLTQPALSAEKLPKWEFAVNTDERASWPIDILHDLLTYWLDQKPDITRGFSLPLMFFLDNTGKLLPV